MCINKKVFSLVKDMSENWYEPREIKAADIRFYMGKNSFVVFHASYLYKKYKNEHLLDLVNRARENKIKFERLNISDIEGISECCHRSFSLYIQFKFLKKEFERYETCIF